MDMNYTYGNGTELGYNPFDMSQYREQIKDAVREAQDIVRWIEKDKAPDSNSKWNRDICIQFCQPIPNTRNYVDPRCPDHCLKANPDWQRLPDETP